MGCVHAPVEAELVCAAMGRDQHNVVIDKKAAEHRRWLGGEDEAVGAGSVFERKAQADRARLSGAQDAVLR